MTKPSESIWSNKKIIIPMAEVSHIEILNDDKEINNRIFIYFKHSKSNCETQMLEPFIYLENENGLNFKKDWCNYRSELEGMNYNPHTLDVEADNLKGFFNEIQNICKTYTK